MEEALGGQPISPTYRETCKKAVAAVIEDYQDPAKRAAEATPAAAPEENTDSTEPQPEIVTIPLSADDELSDIPADQRESVAKEIAAFRERSNKRDLERLKREEEVERLERERNGPRVNRLASPPLSAPTGPSAGSNATPVGPSRLGPIPTRPGGSQFPRDLQKGVSFVSANGTSPTKLRNFTEEEDESEADDEELERRRQEKKDRVLESTFLDNERRWLNRERSRTSALEREKVRDREEEKREQQEKEAMARLLAEFNDDIEAERKVEKYYADRSQWIRNRAVFRQREQEIDARDRQAEEKEAEYQKKHAAENMAESFLVRQVEEIEKASAAAAALPREPQRFKLSLDGAAIPKKPDPRKKAAEVEGLLEEEEDDEDKPKRVLVPLKFEKGAEMSEAQREEAIKSLVKEIPTDREGLFGWNVQWEFVDDAIIKDKLQPFVEKKIVEVSRVHLAILDHVTKYLVSISVFKSKT
jgi:hypothetical protein